MTDILIIAVIAAALIAGPAEAHSPKAYPIRGDLRGGQWLCLLVSHEVGHLAHRGHAKRGLMAAQGPSSHAWCR